MLPEAVWERMRIVDGWFTRMEADTLWDALVEAQGGPWCEVGAYKGRSTIVLGSGGPGTVVDSFRLGTRREFREATRGLPIRLLAHDMEDAAPKVGEVSLLHLDGDHTYRGTKRAFELYGPKVVSGGFVAFHDANRDAKGRLEYPQVAKFVSTVNGEWKHWRDGERLAVFRKQ